MINKVEYNLNYRIKGKKAVKKIEIDFVAMARHDEYRDLKKDITEIQIKYMHIQMLEGEIKSLYDTRPEDYKQSVKVMKEEIEKISAEIMLINQNDVIKRRFEIARDILIDNGYGEDTELISWDFWYNSVDSKDINEFLELAINKDLDKKKIVH